MHDNNDYAKQHHKLNNTSKKTYCILQTPCSIAWEEKKLRDYTSIDMIKYRAHFTCMTACIFTCNHVDLIKIRKNFKHRPRERGKRRWSALGKKPSNSVLMSLSLIRGPTRPVTLLTTDCLK